MAARINVVSFTNLDIANAFYCERYIEIVYKNIYFKNSM